MHKTINSSELKKMILVGAKQLEINRAKVDALNVFPVPDGDTGTNMSLTMQSCVNEMNTCRSSAFSEVCDSVSRGALKGARGNSGVILSQILKGICSVIRKAEKEVDTKTFAKALEAGTKVAYGAVSAPKEGTILTVIRMMSEYATKHASKKKTFEEFFEILTLKQLCRHNKPIAIYNILGYYNELIDVIDAATEKNQKHRAPKGPSFPRRLI